MSKATTLSIDGEKRGVTDALQNPTFPRHEAERVTGAIFELIAAMTAPRVELQAVAPAPKPGTDEWYDAMGEHVEKHPIHTPVPAPVREVTVYANPRAIAGPYMTAVYAYAKRQSSDDIPITFVTGHGPGATVRLKAEVEVEKLKQQLADAEKRAEPVSFTGGIDGDPAVTIERHNGRWAITCGDIQFVGKDAATMAHHFGMMMQEAVKLRQQVETLTKEREEAREVVSRQEEGLLIAAKEIDEKDAHLAAVEGLLSEAGSMLKFAGNRGVRHSALENPSAPTADELTQLGERCLAALQQKPTAPDAKAPSGREEAKARAVERVVEAARKLSVEMKERRAEWPFWTHTVIDGWINQLHHIAIDALPGAHAGEGRGG